LQKLKGKEIINYQSKNNDSTLILMKFEKMKEQWVSKYLENQNQLKKGTTSICFELCFG
jgi:ATP-dependent DNA helicase RecQ